MKLHEVQAPDGFEEWEGLAAARFLTGARW
jgi:hypothetical protein